jgi:hypothetical protein
LGTTPTTRTPVRPSRTCARRPRGSKEPQMSKLPRQHWQHPAQCCRCHKLAEWVASLAQQGSDFLASAKEELDLRISYSGTRIQIAIPSVPALDPPLLMPPDRLREGVCSLRLRGRRWDRVIFVNPFSRPATRVPRTSPELACVRSFPTSTNFHPSPAAVANGFGQHRRIKERKRNVAQDAMPVGT